MVWSVDSRFSRMLVLKASLTKKVGPKQVTSITSVEEDPLAKKAEVFFNYYYAKHPRSLIEQEEILKKHKETFV